MPDPDIQSQLSDIRATLAAQQKILEEIRSSHGSKGYLAGVHWKIMLALAAVVLVFGSIASYGYYKELQSIIDQMPR